jgi:hypothetical protein
MTRRLNFAAKIRRTSPSDNLFKAGGFDRSPAADAGGRKNPLPDERQQDVQCGI